jgi:N-methylhydantoinase B/oxoprolinase/acetone carboxylase alpha subunit
MNVELQVLGSALRAVAEEMGAVLIRSAFSANIKERRDCSTAIFDEAGRMVAQAEHIPVHLGAMPDAVAAAMPWCLTPGQVCARRSATRSRARTMPTSAAWSRRACRRFRASCTRRG